MSQLFTLSHIIGRADRFTGRKDRMSALGHELPRNQIRGAAVLSRKLPRLSPTGASTKGH
jgi:hypothetical protein